LSDPAINTASRSGILSLATCAFVLGSAYVLQAEKSLLPMATWYADEVHRACLALLVWTALTTSPPGRRLAWTVIDTGLLLFPWLISNALPLPFDVRFWLYVLPWLGNAWCGAMAGTALAQLAYALDLPRRVRALFLRRELGAAGANLQLD